MSFKEHLKKFDQGVKIEAEKNIINNHVNGVRLEQKTLN